jgi:hypothetical protein
MAFSAWWSAPHRPAAWPGAPSLWWAPVRPVVSGRRAPAPPRSAGTSKGRKKSKGKVGLPPYLRRNLASLQLGNGRGSATRGWKIAAPKRGRARHALKAKCGSKAFLLPGTEGFPVMNSSCHYSCAGLHAALSRARQFGHPQVAAHARALLNYHCR